MAGTRISPWRIQTNAAGTGNVTQTVAYTATHGTSTAFGSQTYAILVYASSTCHIKIGPAPAAAVTSDFPLIGGGSPLLLGCAPGDKIDVVQDSASGTLYIAEMTH